MIRFIARIISMAQHVIYLVNSDVRIINAPGYVTSNKTLLLFNRTSDCYVLEIVLLRML